MAVIIVSVHYKYTDWVMMAWCDIFLNTIVAFKFGNVGAGI